MYEIYFDDIVYIYKKGDQNNKIELEDLIDKDEFKKNGTKDAKLKQNIKKLYKEGKLTKDLMPKTYANVLNEYNEIVKLLNITDSE